MRVQVEGTHPAAVALREKLQHPSLEAFLVADHPDFSVIVDNLGDDDAHRDLIIVDGVDCDLERRVVANIAEVLERYSDEPILLQRAGGVRSESVIRIRSPLDYQHEEAVVLGVVRGLAQLKSKPVPPIPELNPGVWSRIKKVLTAKLVLLLFAGTVSAQTGPNAPLRVYEESTLLTTTYHLKFTGTAVTCSVTAAMTVTCDVTGGGSGNLSTLVDDVGCSGLDLVRRNSGDTAFECTAPGGTGDVVGPASATNNTVALFDGTTGKLLKDSSLISDDGTLVTLATASEFRSTMASDGSNNLVRLAVGALPSSPSSAPSAILFTGTGAGSATQGSALMRVTYSAGYTGSRLNSGLRVTNTNASVSATLLQYTEVSTGPAVGVYGEADATGSGGRVGVFGYLGYNSRGAALVGWGRTSSNSAERIAVLGSVRNSGAGAQIGGLFALGGDTATPSYTTSAALIADNMDQTAPIILGRDNGIEVFSVQDGGNVRIADSASDHYYTITRSDIAADRNLALPLLTADDTFDVLGLAQTFSARKTFGAGVTISSGQVIEGTEAAAPGTPAAGQVILYAKSGTPGEWCSKDDAGVETCMSAGSGGSSDPSLYIAYGGL